MFEILNNTNSNEKHLSENQIRYQEEKLQKQNGLDTIGSIIKN